MIRRLLHEKMNFVKLSIGLTFLLIGTCSCLTIKDLRSCSNTASPPLDSVVLINCTEEPCFFGKVNGLSFQFIFTPERSSTSVVMQITAVDGYGNNYDIDAIQRTSCSESYCELEANVPRCFSAAVRRKYAPDYDEADFYTFTVRFTEPYGNVLACSRFVLTTYIRYTKDSYSDSYGYTTTSRPSYATTARPNYSDGYSYSFTTTNRPATYTNNANSSNKPFGASFPLDKIIKEEE